MKAIRRLRVALGFSQARLASELGVTPGAVAHWEAGRIVPRASMIRKICRRYGAHMAEEGIRPLDLIEGDSVKAASGGIAAT